MKPLIFAGAIALAGAAPAAADDYASAWAHASLAQARLIAGAAGEDRGKVSFRDVIGGKTNSGFRFG